MYEFIKQGVTLSPRHLLNNLLILTPPTPAEIAHRKRFGMVSSITAEIQSRYDRIDHAAAARQQIWLKVKYLYDKHVNDVTDEKELRKLILEKYEKSTLKPR